MGELFLTMLFDPHLHLRVGVKLETVLPLVLPYCQAGIPMPNDGNIKTASEAVIRHQEIRTVATGAGYPDFRTYMSVLLTDGTKPADVELWAESGIKIAKYIPAGLYSHGGVSDLAKISDVIRQMERVEIVFSGHFEKAGVNPLEAEAEAIPLIRYLADEYPDLRIVVEHITDWRTVQAVMQYGPNVVATISPQAFWMTAGDIFDQGGRIAHPHNWCRPPMKNLDDRLAIRVAAMSGNPKFFFGSDFAPYAESDKQGENPKAGVANYPAAIPLLVTLFEHFGRLEHLENFISTFAARFYGIELRKDKIRLVEEPFTVPDSIPFVGTDGSDPSKRIIPWLAGQTLPWSVKAA